MPMQHLSTHSNSGCDKQRHLGTVMQRPTALAKTNVRLLSMQTTFCLPMSTNGETKRVHEYCASGFAHCSTYTPTPHQTKARNTTNTTAAPYPMSVPTNYARLPASPYAPVPSSVLKPAATSTLVSGSPPPVFQFKKLAKPLMTLCTAAVLSQKRWRPPFTQGMQSRRFAYTLLVSYTSTAG